MTNVLITGGAGEVGLTLTKEFIKEGIDVYGIDDINREEHEELAYLGRNALYHFTNKSITCVDFTQFEPVDVIFHLGQRSPSTNKYSDLRTTFKNQKKNTELIVNFASTCGATVVLVSTLDVYGEQLADPNPNIEIPLPRSLYGSYMLSEETFLVSSATANDVKYCILRIPPIDGFNNLIEKRCQGIDEIEKAGVSSQCRELINGQSISKKKLVDYCFSILNGGIEEKVITLFNKY
ncbi:NAD-dependent epimerase/dehydratase family protein [Pseudalkalibacillus berkeleyi]|uniref:NAD(P)-dependent oxidoreductase n=1 Tax=Pseudalkalibacillus berkeleyi TaxID=1069813 RepID=A0ABS9GYV4_9BACL|nr:NAD(P)-dependent oxidoreductase [Pseudalkalibacillus berkeleyi]MCF6136829.1 NAD(P)-dependent oxidoreductase [Pseudalkalibacillus berkeleyi]